MPQPNDTEILQWQWQWQQQIDKRVTKARSDCGGCKITNGSHLFVVVAKKYSGRYVVEGHENAVDMTDKSYKPKQTHDCLASSFMQKIDKIYPGSCWPAEDRSPGQIIYFGDD